jgi:hypothetical protein
LPAPDRLGKRAGSRYIGAMDNDTLLKLTASLVDHICAMARFANASEADVMVNIYDELRRRAIALDLDPDEP